MHIEVSLSARLVDSRRAGDSDFVWHLRASMSILSILQKASVLTITLHRGISVIIIRLDIRRTDIKVVSLALVYSVDS